MNLVKQYREKRKISQGELARRVGVTQGWLCKIESGQQSKIGLDLGIALAKALKVKVETLFPEVE